MNQGYSTRISMSGKVYGRLKVIKYDHTNNDGKALWKCICDCGNKAIVSGKSLRLGLTKSCGCLHRELVSKRLTKHGGSIEGGTKEYNIWKGIIARCTIKSATGFNVYGGRGIKICDRWKEFKNFISDMGPAPSEKHSIDRVNNLKGYSPGNCRWATYKEQANNRNNGIKISINGAIFNIDQLAAKSGLMYSTIYRRYMAGETGDLLIGPLRKIKRNP